MGRVLRYDTTRVHSILNINKKVIRNRNYGINKDEVGVSWMKEKSLAFRGVSEGTDVVKIDFGVNDERGH